MTTHGACDMVYKPEHVTDLESRRTTRSLRWRSPGENFTQITRGVFVLTRNTSSYAGGLSPVALPSISW